MVLVSHEDLITNQDHCYASWELNGGHHRVEEDPSKSTCQRIWESLNGKTANTIIILATLLEALVIVAELLIDLKIIQDPHSQALCNKTYDSGGSGVSSDGDIREVSIQYSQTLRITKDVLAYTSIAILAFFLFEILLRILTGKGKYLKQTKELGDGIVVVLAFSLDLAFFLTAEQNSEGQVAAVFIILLRLWRISRLVQSIIHEAKREMGHIINAYKRDKIHAEHKVEILILKVEDLEHEVAYLKEKLKKTEREAATQKKRKGRSDHLCQDNGVDALHCLSHPASPHHNESTPWKSVPILSFSGSTTCLQARNVGAVGQPNANAASIHSYYHSGSSGHHHHHYPLTFQTLSASASPAHSPMSSALHSPVATSPVTRLKSPRRRRSQDGAELQEFVKFTVDRILQSASMELDTITEEGGGANKEKRSSRGVEQHDSGRGSTPGSTPRASTLQQEDDDYESTAQPIYSSVPDVEIGDVETDATRETFADDPEPNEPNPDRPRGDLDEFSEIERVKKVDFNLVDESEDIPVTAL